MTGDFSYARAMTAAQTDREARERGEPIERFRIVEVNEYLGREEEWSGLSLGEAAIRMDEQTGVGADVVLADFDEDCTRCEGEGGKVASDAKERGELAAAGGHSPAAAGWIPCTACHGTGKRREPWEWKDDETGREVTLRREVE